MSKDNNEVDQFMKDIGLNEIFRPLAETALGQAKEIIAKQADVGQHMLDSDCDLCDQDPTACLNSGEYILD